MVRGMGVWECGGQGRPPLSGYRTPGQDFGLSLAGVPTAEVWLKEGHWLQGRFLGKVGEWICEDDSS